MCIDWIGTVGAIVSGVSRTPRSVAADRLLASRKFHQAIENIGQRRSQQALVDSDEYKEWLGTLSPEDAQAVGALGIMAWLAREEQ